MTQDELMTSLYRALRDNLKWPHLAAFSADARLNEDLYLDSILILQLLLHLELEQGIQIADDALVAGDFQTVAELAQALCNSSKGSSAPAAIDSRAGVHD
ncbi:phosphopantetheine-binding protein [Hydrocarboniclastica marina]|uniref:phosphopantetheine-binding protein n=1 Tax=Hydrocarboniclastica marina TaxID=2259620 RepID=UPI001C12B50A|nr:phosphopantetheine-binding protein [Hydrocarboniclastica marina]|tara:strand:- start:2063 stop:2362 length:300 start_codon:yes stop_codon:yes gene_type:complete